MRSPSILSETRLSRCRRRTSVARNARIECGCQPVASIIAAMLAPSGSFNILSSRRFFVPRWSGGLPTGVKFLQPLIRGRLLTFIPILFNTRASNATSPTGQSLARQDLGTNSAVVRAVCRPSDSVVNRPQVTAKKEQRNCSESTGFSRKTEQRMLLPGANSPSLAVTAPRGCSFRGASALRRIAPPVPMES